MNSDLTRPGCAKARGARAVVRSREARPAGRKQFVFIERIEVGFYSGVARMDPSPPTQSEQHKVPTPRCLSPSEGEREERSESAFGGISSRAGLRGKPIAEASILAVQGVVGGAVRAVRFENRRGA